MRHEIAFSRWFLPLAVITGLWPRWSDIETDADDVSVRMSWAFRATIPRKAVASVSRPERRPLSIGVHGWRGRWLVNGSTRNLVTIDIEPAARCQVIGVPLRLNQLMVSVDDPDRLIADLTD